MAKRFFFIVLALAVLLTVGWAAPKKRLIAYHWTQTAYDPINFNAVKLFESKHPDVEVMLLLVPDGERVNTIRTVMAANGQIDMFALSNGQSAEFLAAGQMVPIIPSAFGKKTVEDVVKMWDRGAMRDAGGYWNGKYYGIPFELASYVAWINTAFMKEAGLDPKTDTPKTWDAFAAVGKKLVKNQGGTLVRNGFMCNSTIGFFNFLVLLAMMEQLGQDWGTEEGLVASLGHPQELARGLKTYTDFVVRDKIWDPALESNDRTGMGMGTTAMFLTGGSWFWGVADYYKLPRTDIEPFAYPRFKDGKDIGGVVYGHCLYVAKLSKEPELAFQLIDTMASQPNIFIKGGFRQPRITLSNGAQAVDPAVVEQSIPYYNEVFKPEHAKGAVWLFSAKGNQVMDSVWAAISRVIYKRTSVDASVARLRTDIKAMYK